MKRALPTFLLAALAALLVATPAWSASAPARGLDVARFVADSARFDQAYIPALAVTSDAKAEASVKAMAVLRPAWAAYQGAWAGAMPSDAQWAADFAAVGQRIAAADAIVARGTELVQAHEELEHVRLTLLHLRQRHGIAHYTDYLTRFHDDMEAIVLAAKGKHPDTFTAADRAVIAEHLPRAQGLWADVLAAPLDGALFGLDDRAVAALRAALAEEQQALRALEAQLNGVDTPALIAAAVAIKPPFAKAFKRFGNFAPVL